MVLAQLETGNATEDAAHCEVIVEQDGQEYTGPYDNSTNRTDLDGPAVGA